MCVINTFSLFSAGLCVLWVCVLQCVPILILTTTIKSILIVSNDRDANELKSFSIVYYDSIRKKTQKTKNTLLCKVYATIAFTQWGKNGKELNQVFVEMKN